MTSGARPHRLWRLFAIALAGCVVLVLAAVIGLRVAYPPERLAGMLGELVERSSGRHFRINGELSIRLLPTLAVVANDVTLSNADWGSRPQMLTMRRIALAIALRPLLEGQVHILGIDLAGAEVLLEYDRNGRSNWQFDNHRDKGDEPGALPSIGIERLVLSDARFVLGRAGKTETDEIAVARLELLPGVDRLGFAAELTHAGRHWQAEGRTGPWPLLFGGGSELPFELRAATAGGQLTATGKLGLGAQAGELRADLSARVSEAAALAAFVADGMALPMPIEFAATVVRHGDELRAEPLRIVLAGQHLQGRLAMRSGTSPARIEGELSSPSIDGAKLLGQPPVPLSAEGGRKVLFTDRPWPFASLPAIPLQLAFRVDRLLLPGLPALAAVEGRLQAGPGRFALDPLSFKLADGTFAVSLGIDQPRAAEPLTTLAVEGKALSVEALDALAGHGARFHGGRAGLSAKLTMQGVTPRKMAASASGNLRFSTQNVLLTGKAANMERNLLAALFQAFIPERQVQQGVSIQCTVFNLPLRRGVARIDRSIALETDDMAVSASGEVNLADETLQLAFQPQVKKGLGLSQASLAQLVMLKGSLLAPEVGIDPKGTVNEAASLGVAVATGGLSLVAERMLGERGSSAACRTALAAAGGAGAPEGRRGRRAH